MNNTKDYSLFHNFNQNYSSNGFNGINVQDPLMRELELMMKKNNQFFFVGDIIKMEILYTSPGSLQLMGFEPENITPYIFFEATHPDDIDRHTLARTQLFKMAHDLFIAKKGASLLSSNLKIRCNDGKYKCLLFQCLLFYSENPLNTVYLLQVQTDVDWCKKNKQAFHYYSGNDLSYFKYPDEELLQMGNIFTKREFEIIKLIQRGLNSEQISEKLFLSPFTVNAHRANILKKSKNATMSEVIHGLNKKGLL